MLSAYFIGSTLQNFHYCTLAGCDSKRCLFETKFLSVQARRVLKMDEYTCDDHTSGNWILFVVMMTVTNVRMNMGLFINKLILLVIVVSLEFKNTFECQTSHL